jgi:DNA-binding response OmpR family regulator
VHRQAVHKTDYNTVVVVADLNQASGLECLGALRSEIPRTWIIVISLRFYPDAQAAVFGSGADSLLIAPFSLTELRRRLLAFARRSRPSHVS